MWLLLFGGGEGKRESGEGELVHGRVCARVKRMRMSVQVADEVAEVERGRRSV